MKILTRMLFVALVLGFVNPVKAKTFSQQWRLQQIQERQEKFMQAHNIEGQSRAEYAKTSELTCPQNYEETEIFFSMMVETHEVLKKNTYALLFIWQTLPNFDDQDALFDIYRVVGRLADNVESRIQDCQRTPKK